MTEVPGTAGPKGWEDFGEGYMAGSGGVPSGHAVAVEVPVVLLQLLQAVKPHKAVLALFFHAQKVLAPACTTHKRLAGSSSRATSLYTMEIIVICVNSNFKFHGSNERR